MKNFIKNFISVLLSFLIVSSSVPVFALEGIELDTENVTNTEQDVISGEESETDVIEYFSTENDSMADNPKSATVEYDITSISFEITQINLGLGEYFNLVVCDQDENDVTDKVEFVSDNSSVVTVSNGTIYAKNKGTATVTASYDNGVQSTCNVTVSDACQSLYLNVFTAGINVGENQFKVEYTLVGGSSGNVTFSSSNTDIATVDENGMLTGVSNGTCTITATTYNGRKSSCRVIVSDSEKDIQLIPTELNFDTAELKLGYGESYKATVTDQYGKAVTSVVKYTTSNPSVVTVSNGTIYAKDKGTATVTASYDNGVQSICNVTVSDACQSLYLNVFTAGINVGEDQFKVEYTLVGGITGKVTFESSDTDIATVDENGMLTGVSNGTCTITVTTLNGKKSSCRVIVSDNEKEIQYIPTVLNLDITSLKIACKESYKMTVTDQYGKAVTGVVNYTTSNSSVATVSNGKIYGKGKGTATITVSYYNGVKTSFKVTVENACTSIYLNVFTANIQIGENQFDLDYTLNGGYSRSVTFVSSDTDIATVDENGMLTGVSYGTCTITATTFNGKKSSCRVIVGDKKEIQYIPTVLKLNISSVKIGCKESYKLTVTDQYGKAVTGVVNYTTSNSSVATASNGTIYGKGKGTATITVSYYNGVKTSCKVTVENACTSISLNVTSATIGVNEKSLNLDYQLKGGISNSIKFTSSNTAVATVESNGVVTGKKPGTATITCATFNGKKATCKVTVKNAPTSLNISNKNTKVQYGTSMYKVKYSLGGNAASYAISFKSSNTSVATVSSSGVVSGKKTGKATITVSAYNGKKDTINISVVNENNCLTLNRTATQISYDYDNVKKEIFGKSTQGRNLEAFIITPTSQKYTKTYVMTFAIHGFEDSYYRDGQLLTQEANKLVEYYAKNPSKLQNYRLVIIPCLNPDGTIAGENNYRECSSAFGRCTAAHIDMNRDFVNFKAVETRATRDFLKKYKPDLFTDFHGWMNTTIGTSKMGSIFKRDLGLSYQQPDEFNKTYIQGYVKKTYNCPSVLVEYRSTSTVNHNKTYTAINNVIDAY